VLSVETKLFNVIETMLQSNTVCGNPAALRQPPGSCFAESKPLQLSLVMIHCDHDLGGLHDLPPSLDPLKSWEGYWQHDLAAACAVRRLMLVETRCCAGAVVIGGSERLFVVELRCRESPTGFQIHVVVARGPRSPESVVMGVMIGGMSIVPDGFIVVVMQMHNASDNRLECGGACRNYADVELQAANSC